MNGGLQNQEERGSWKVCTIGRAMTIYMERTPMDRLVKKGFNGFKLDALQIERI